MMAKNSLDYNQFNEIPERFWKYVIKTDTCWLWLGKTDDGYGRFHINYKFYLTHRLIYAVMKSKLGSNSQIDHLCKNRNCCNPDHLEEVTHIENTRRGLAKKFNTDPNKCPHGHDYDYQIPGKAEGSIYKVCRTCRDRNSKRYQNAHV
jgi:hypothetical protein